MTRPRPATDPRLLVRPFTTVECTRCGARVQARKSSWEQTTLQWDQQAVEACLERADLVDGRGPNGQVFPGCRALSASIRDAVTGRRLRIATDQPQVQA